MPAIAVVLVGVMADVIRGLVFAVRTGFARLRGFREFVSTDSYVETMWTEVLRGWEAGGGSVGTRSSTP